MDIQSIITVLYDLKERFIRMVSSFNELEYKNTSITPKAETDVVEEQGVLDSPQITSGDLRQVIHELRDSKNITLMVNPNYHPLELRLITRGEVDALLLKHRLNPSNVNSRERRLLTVRAYYYDVFVSSELVLVDETTVQYINYFNSRMSLEIVSPSVLDEYRADKSYEQNPFYLKFFTSVVRVYEDLKAIDRLLPIEFLTHFYAHIERGGVLADLEQFNDLERFLRMYLTLYSIIYKKPIPEDYHVINKDLKTNFYYLNNLLNNIEHEPRTEEATAPARHLMLVK